MPGLLLDDFVIIGHYRKPPNGWTEDMIVSDIEEMILQGGVELHLESRSEDSLFVMLRPAKKKIDKGDKK
jgi:hypothetical protein